MMGIHFLKSWLVLEHPISLFHEGIFRVCVLMRWDDPHERTRLFKQVTCTKLWGGGLSFETFKCDGSCGKVLLLVSMRP